MVDDGQHSTSMMQQIFYLPGQLWTTDTPGIEGAQFSIPIKKRGGRACQHSRKRPAGTGGRSEVTEAPLLPDCYSKRSRRKQPGCHSPRHLVCLFHDGETHPVDLVEVKLKFRK